MDKNWESKIENKTKTEMEKKLKLRNGKGPNWRKICLFRIVLHKLPTDWCDDFHRAGRNIVWECPKTHSFQLMKARGNPQMGIRSEGLES